MLPRAREDDGPSRHVNTHSERFRCEQDLDQAAREQKLYHLLTNAIRFVGLM